MEKWKITNEENEEKENKNIILTVDPYDLTKMTYKDVQQLCIKNNNLCRKQKCKLTAITSSNGIIHN